MNIRERMLDKMCRLLPRKEKLKGGWLHGVLGERLFAPELWRFSRGAVASGTALGVFIAMTPTMGLHMVAAVIMGFVLRVNIPAAVASCWVVNPVNALFIYCIEYKVGVWCIGAADPQEYVGYMKMFKHFFGMARPLFAGSLILGIPAAIVSYLVVYFGWGAARKYIEGRGSAPSEGDDA